MRTVRLRPRGLPQRLPAGERLLWQGSPDAATLRRRVFHMRVVALYFGLIVAWSGWSAAASGLPLNLVAIGLFHRLALSAVPLLLIAVYAWGIQRSTIYSITSRRVVISFGIALPVSFNIPFSKIEAAGLHVYPNGAGDIPLRLLPTERMSYLVMWPHTRPWRAARTEPMLRCVPGVQEASDILAQALAEHQAQAENTALADGQELPHTAQQQTVARPGRLVPSSGQRPAQAAAA